MSFGDDLEVFVREVLQNSLDARIEGDAPVEVELRLTRLEREAKSAFLEAAAWRDLEPHLAAAQPLFPAIADARRRLNDPKAPLVLLAIEDRNAVGLSGPEKGSGRFASFARNKLMSEKQSDDAAGSYGLGKSVLWRYSGLSTIFVHSRPRSGDDNEVSRFLGIAQLPFHQIGAEECDGPGWYGTPHVGWAESVRPAPPALVDALDATRRLHATGTSIVVPDFVPARDRDSLSELGREIERYAARWFWPSIVGSAPRMCVDVRVDGEARRVEPSEWELESFLRLAAQDAEPRRSDVKQAWIPIKLPETQEEMRGIADFRPHRAIEVQNGIELTLLLPDSPDAQDKSGQVALMRGAGMVVEYVELRHGGRGCTALARAGTAVGDEPDHHLVEQFLRTAEPPSHDRWTGKAPRLRERYKRGYVGELESLHKRIVEKARELALDATRATADVELPKALRKAMSISEGRTRGDPETRARFDFGVTACELADDGEQQGWWFSGWASHSHDGAWQIEVQCSLAGETEGEHLALSSLWIDGASVNPAEPATIPHPGRIEFRGNAPLPEDPLARDASIWVDVRARVADG